MKLHSIFISFFASSYRFFFQLFDLFFPHILLIFFFFLIHQFDFEGFMTCLVGWCFKKLLVSSFIFISILSCSYRRCRTRIWVIQEFLSSTLFLCLFSFDKTHFVVDIDTGDEKIMTHMKTMNTSKCRLFSTRLFFSCRDLSWGLFINDVIWSFFNDGL